MDVDSTQEDTAGELATARSLYDWARKLPQQAKEPFHGLGAPFPHEFPEGFGGLCRMGVGLLLHCATVSQLPSVCDGAGILRSRYLADSSRRTKSSRC